MSFLDKVPFLRNEEEEPHSISSVQSTFATFIEKTKALIAKTREITKQWKNGLTGETQSGEPPEHWHLNDDGFYYPPETTEFRRIPPIAHVPQTTTPSSMTVLVLTRIAVVNPPATITVDLDVNLTVKPSVPVFESSKQEIPTSLHITPIPLDVKQGVLARLKKLAEPKINNFFDVDRRGKTLLNFGQDFQTVITDWSYEGNDKTAIRANLYLPLPDDVEDKTQLWISRELASPVVDRIHVKFTPPPPPKVYLRPANTSVALTGRTGVSVENVTLSNLFSTTAFDEIIPNDPVIEEWYTDDVNSTELNIDYTDYRNFVFFGSAEARLNAFITKLGLIEEYESLLVFNSSSLSVSGSTPVGMLSYTAIQNLADKRIDLFRSFDGYERFLYYSSGSEYSSSLSTNDAMDAVYFNEDCTWPKIGGVPVPVASASAWITAQTAIATAYDVQNQNYLKNNTPEYITKDEQSQEFVQFLNLAGHHFDTLKPYIDHMTKIYDRGNNPLVNTSQDIIWNVAQGFGIDLPNQYAVQRLVDYTIGETNVATPTIYREAAAETWKRFVHNQIFLMKSKGTKAALRGLANAYGILPSSLQIRELSTLGNTHSSGTFETFEEQTNALTFTSGSYVKIPWAASSSLSASTIELRFATTNNTAPIVLVQADNVWALKTEPLSGSYGRLILTDGVTRASSSYFSIFSGDFYSVMIRDTTNVELYVTRAEGDTIVDTSSTAEAGTILHNKWFSPTTLFLGGSGSLFGQPYAGYMDEFRLWTEKLNTTIFDNHVRYPGLYNGNQPTSARDTLAVRLSFNQAKNLFATSSLNNESPFNPTQTFQTVGFQNVTSAPYNMTVMLREVTRFSPNAGSQFTSDKIVIADEPELVYFSGSAVPVLSPKNSIVSLNTKRDNRVNSNVVGFYFSITDAINDSILRSIGNIDLQNLLGDPADQYNSSYESLRTLSNLYWTSYAYSYNVNSFVDFVRNLLEPLFKQARELVPVRAKLLSGIVHEPHLLERSKVASRPIEVSGGSLTRHNQSDTHNLEAPALTSHPTDIDAGVAHHEVAIITNDLRVTTGEFNNHEALITTSDVYNPSALYDDLTATVETQETVTSTAEKYGYESTILMNDAALFGMELITFDDFTNAIAFKNQLLARFGAASITSLTAQQRNEYNKLLNRYRSASSVNVYDQYIYPSNQRMGLFAPDAQLEMVLPYTNFDDIEAYTYFTDPNGTVGFDGIVYNRVKENILRNRGTWARGTVYSRLDYVVQVGSENAPEGNGKEFECISSDGTFTSYIDPYLDTANWKSVSYVPVASKLPRKAILVDGKVSIAPTTSVQPTVVGYRPTHYKFTRDNREGIKRHLWLGCKQTDETTTDGQPAIEVKFVAGSELFVANGTLQTENNDAGPILDVF